MGLIKTVLAEQPRTMPHLWEHHETIWEPAPLLGNRELLPGLRVCRAGQQPSAIPGLPETWLLLSTHRDAVRVNGDPLLIGARVLHDRDEITAFSRRYFFSTEKPPEIVTFRTAECGAAFCARCKKAMEDGQPAVACPACGTWHHQSEAMPCWLYAKTCALCQQPTALDAGYQWTPDEEVWL